MKYISPGILSSPKYLTTIANFSNDTIADLSANENCLGASPLAAAAYKQHAEQLHRYSDGNHSKLRTELGEKFSVDPNMITCGAGSDELISLICRIFTTSGGIVLFPEYSFIMFSINAMRVGAQPVSAKATDYGTDVKQLLSTVNSKTQLIFVANPNNPTGTCLNAKQLFELAQSVPHDIPLVIDSAYAEYVDDENYCDGLALVREFPNVIMLRTFSKAYGLASLRVGWCVAAPEVIELLNRCRGPYNISGAAEAAAIVALRDEKHFLRTTAHVREWRSTLAFRLQEFGVSVINGYGNFVCAGFKDPTTASRIQNSAEENGIRIRSLQSYGMPNYLRITVGLGQSNMQLLNIIKSAL